MKVSRKMTMTMINYFLRRIIEIQLESLSVILKFLTSARALEDDVYFYSEKYFRNTLDIHPNNLVFPSRSRGLFSPSVVWTRKVKILFNFTPDQSIVMTRDVSPGVGIIFPSGVIVSLGRQTHGRCRTFYQIKSPARFLFQS